MAPARRKPRTGEQGPGAPAHSTGVASYVLLGTVEIGMPRISLFAAAAGTFRLSGGDSSRGPAAPGPIAPAAALATPLRQPPATVRRSRRVPTRMPGPRYSRQP